MKKKNVLLLIILLLISNSFSYVLGTGGIQKIAASINYDIQIKLNGERFKPVNESGKPLSPIIYEGRSYLPVRVLSEALGFAVDWNDASKTIIINNSDSNLGIPYKDSKEYTDGKTKPTSSYITPKVYAKVVDGKVKLYWDKINDHGFSGYKVVASSKNKQPVYPNDGYLAFISDKDTDYMYINKDTKYYEGDFGSHFTSGKTYYLSITAIYQDKNVKGNSVVVIFP